MAIPIPASMRAPGSGLGGRPKRRKAKKAKKGRKTKGRSKAKRRSTYCLYYKSNRVVCGGKKTIRKALRKRAKKAC